MLSSARFLNQVAPTNQSERIIFLDSLRGIAVLGILLINIQGFGLPQLLVYDVSVLHENGLNYFTWYVFGPGVFEGSMRAIFSMLFGAGTMLFISRLEKRIKGLKPLEFFFRGNSGSCYSVCSMPMCCFGMGIFFFTMQSAGYFFFHYAGSRQNIY